MCLALLNSVTSLAETPYENLAKKFATADQASFSEEVSLVGKCWYKNDETNIGLNELVDTLTVRYRTSKPFDFSVKLRSMVQIEASRIPEKQIQHAEELWDFCEVNGYEVKALEIKKGDLTGGGCYLTNVAIRFRKSGDIYFARNDRMDAYCYFDKLIH